MELPTKKPRLTVCPNCGGALPVTLKGARENLEREMILQSLQDHSGKIAAAAEGLGVSRPTLYEMMERLNIQRDSPSSSESDS
jgi:two-component system NtrC family response regulator